MFGAAGDTGAFGCIRSDGTTGPASSTRRPSRSSPSVGGTSFENFNPGTNPHPSYPLKGEAAWNVDNLCKQRRAECGQRRQGGFFWCAATGAGGGGNSIYWGRPSYQKGAGVINAGHTSNGTRLPAGQGEHPVPRGTGHLRRRRRVHAVLRVLHRQREHPVQRLRHLQPEPAVPGWFGIGGTSLSAPLLSAMVADRDSFQHHRTGNFNTVIYKLYQFDPSIYFHDITGNGHVAKGNGLFPAVPGYDLATGVGTPKASAIITGLF